LGHIDFLKIILALTFNVKSLRLISTFAPIRMLDLGQTLALDFNVKGA
jgi:hypothetical protein